MELTIGIRNRRARYELTLDLRQKRARRQEPDRGVTSLRPTGTPHEVAARHALASGSRPVAPIR
jgi:hypothetical protein